MKWTFCYSYQLWIGQELAVRVALEVPAVQIVRVVLQPLYCWSWLQVSRFDRQEKWESDREEWWAG
jgi:hypothetical protein